MLALAPPLRHAIPKLSHQLCHFLALELVSVKLFDSLEDKRSELQLVFHDGDILAGFKVEGKKERSGFIEWILL